MNNHPSVTAGPVCVRALRRRSAGPFCLLFVLFVSGGCGRSDQDRFSTVVQNASCDCVQMNYATPQASVTTVSVTFTAAQSAGDLSVVVVGWNDTTEGVASVTDTKGNAYQLAVCPTALAGLLTQSIYYAKNIAAAGAGANTVTVSFTVAATFADIRILEYGGMDPASPVEVTASATGNSATSSTPALVTTNAADLLFAANIVWPNTTGPGTGWTSRVITSPDGDIAEDQAVATAGSYSVTAPLSGAGPWVMQAVAFKAASGGPPPPPTAPTNLPPAATTSSQIDLPRPNTPPPHTPPKRHPPPATTPFPH